MLSPSFQSESSEGSLRLTGPMKKYDIHFAALLLSTNWQRTRSSTRITSITFRMTTITTVPTITTVATLGDKRSLARRTWDRMTSCGLTVAKAFAVTGVTIAAAAAAAALTGYEPVSMMSEAASYIGPGLTSCQDTLAVMGKGLKHVLSQASENIGTVGRPYILAATDYIPSVVSDGVSCVSDYMETAASKIRQTELGKTAAVALAGVGAYLKRHEYSSRVASNKSARSGLNGQDVPSENSQPSVIMTPSSGEFSDADQEPEEARHEWRVPEEK